MTFSSFSENLLDIIREDDEFRTLLQPGENDGCWIIDIEHPEKTFTDEKYWSALGHDASERTNASDEWRNIVHPDDLSRCEGVVVDILSGKAKRTDTAVRFIRPDQSVIWIRCRAVGAKNHRGEIVKVIGVHTDLSKELDMRSSSAFTQRIFQDFFMLSKNFLCIGHVSGEFLKINFSFLKALGYSDSDIIGKSYSDVIHPEDWPSTRVKLLASYHGADVVEFKNRVLHKNGSYRTVEWKAVSRGSLIYGSGEDVTEKDNAQRIMEAHQELLRDVTDNVPGAIIRFTTSGEDANLLFVSKGIEEIFRVKPEEYNLLEFIKFVHPEDLEKLINSFRDALSDRSNWSHEFRIVNGNETQWIYGSGNFKILDEGSRLWHILLVDITDKKNQERKFLRTQRLLEQTNEVAKVGGWELDLSSKKLFWTSITKRIHKLPDSFVPSSEAAFQFYKEGYHRDKIKSLLTLLLKTGKPFTEELQITDAEGNILWVQVTGTSEIENGRCVRMYGSFQDISERKEAERKFLESEIRFRSFVENLDDIIFTLNCAGEFTYVSPNVPGFIGYEVDMILGTHFGLSLHRDDLQACLDYIANAYSRHPSQKDPVYYRVKHLNGEWRWFAAKGTAIDVDGKKQFLGVARDVTNEKKFEGQLIASEQQAVQLALYYKTLIDSQNVFTITMDAKGIYTYCNQYFLDFFGLDESILGTNAMHTVLPEDQGKVNEVIRKCCKYPGISHPVILRRRTGIGEVKGSKWEFRGTTDEKKSVSEIVSIGYDITEQLSSLEKAQELIRITSDQNFKLKSFSHIVSHNIRSHSANLVSLADFIAETTNEDEKNNFISMLKISTHKLEETIRNLSEIINIEESTEKTKQRINLYQEISKTIESLNASIFRHKITVVNKVEKNITVHAVHTYLESILLNLLSNAVRYRSPERPATIEISCEVIPHYLVLSVKDNGLGIDMHKYAHKLFGMYRTFHGNEDARGFGLYITKTQIEAMGGKIDVESTVNTGSTFKVYFRDRPE